MSNFELFDDDFWTTRSSGNIAGTTPSGSGSSGQGAPPPRCEGCDETSPYGENSCSSEQSCGCPVDGANPRSASGIHYSSGSTQKTCTDASVSGGAVPWSFKRTQDSHDQYYLSRSAGTGWKTSQTAQIGQYPNFYRVEFSEKDAVNFSLTPAPDGTYKALDNYPETLTIDPVTSAYTIVRKNGTVWNFSGSTVAILQHVQNEEGRQTLFSYDSAGRLWKVQQLSETEQVVSEMEYTYDTASQESIVEIVVRKGKSGILHNQTRIAYTYYQDGESFGNAGDLKMVQNAVWSEAAQAWQDTSAEYYRYYTQSGTFGKKHQLRMEFNAVDFAFLREKFGEQWQTISDDTALDYCTQYFEYDDRNRISLTRKNRNRLVFRYAYENYAETSDYNAITCKTIEYGPHGEQTLVFTNFRDKVLLKKITPPDTSDEPPAIYYFRYDSRGNVTHSYNPKCVLDYSIETGQSATLSVSLSPDEGRIEITEYGNGTTTPADQPLARYLQNGTSGNRIVLQRYEYTKRQVDSRIRWYVSSLTHYTDEAGTNSATTSYAYTFFPNSLQISRRTTTLPDSANREECFDISGRITWQKDELGIITYHGYDVVSGLEIRTIQDVDTAKTSDFTTPVPSGWSTVPEAGKHLIYETEYDVQGRVTQTLGPANESVNTENRNILTRSARWTIYDDVNFRITSANGFIQIGENLAEHIVNPVIVTISDVNGRLLESITARRISTSGRLTAADVFLQTDYLSWSVNIYAGDQLVEKRDYFTIPTNGPGEESAHYNATRYHYDAYGRRDLIISPDGTVTKTVFDWQDNPTQTWLGTSPADLTLVAETLYGGEDGGCPTCSGTTAKPRLTIQHVDADTMRITEYGYDWRGRRIHVHNEEDENGLSIYNLTTYDNLDRTIKTERYLSLDPVPDRLLARTETFYDMRGNVWKTEQSIVNPADGTVQGKLLARSWFDAAGRTIRTQALGENRATVTAYDSLGRVVSAAIQLDEVVFEKTETSYDDLGHILQTAFSQRLADGFGFRTSYTANWYDPAGRSVASANYGALASFTRSATVPERSDDTLVTTTFYDSATGDPLKTLDPAGRETRTFTDALGRTVKTVSNFTDGTISAARPDCNVTVLYTYHPSGQVETMTVKNPVTGDQITRYAYSLGRLTHEFYPDSSSPTDCVSYTYNRLGERTSKRDQNGTVHAYTYDNLGRMVADTVTQFGDSIDRTVQKITTSYTPDGKTASITSHGANDTILNQISYEYDACGLLSKEWQSLLGDPATLYTGYTYDTTQTEGYFTKKLRPTGYVFPDGWNCFYGYDNTYDDLFNRPTRIHSLTVTQAEYQYMGVQTPVVTKYPVPGLTLDYTNGLDRFGRIIRHSWKNAASQPVVEIHHDYDRSGNRLNRTDIAAGAAFNESYQYDQQNQLINLDRTDCHERFHYDTTGNRLAWRHNDTIQNRTHNPANEIVSIDHSDVCVRTDAAGNMTRIPNPKAGIVRADYSSVFCVTRRFAAPRRVEPESLNLTYDAWNRLVRVTKPAGNLVAEYRYDGLNRRVLKTTSCETRRFYYNRNWQCVQETVEDQPTIHYTWGLRYVDDLVCRHTDTTPIYSLADANWNVVALTDAAGTPVERYTYTAFGKLNIYDGAFTPRSASNYNWTRTFTGQVLDNETGLMLYRNRFYHPKYGRFLTRDLIGYKGDILNQYRYVTNLPNKLLDYKGLKCIGCTLLQSCIMDCEDSCYREHIGNGTWNPIRWAQYTGCTVGCKSGCRNEDFTFCSYVNNWDQKYKEQLSCACDILDLTDLVVDSLTYSAPRSKALATLSAVLSALDCACDALTAIQHACAGTDLNSVQALVQVASLNCLAAFVDGLKSPEDFFVEITNKISNGFNIIFDAMSMKMEAYFRAQGHDIMYLECMKKCFQ